MRMLTISKYTANADLLILFACRTACWMAANRLQLNHAKSEVLWCSSTRRQHQISSRAVHIRSTAVQPVSAVRDLGIMLDAEVTMSTHVRKKGKQLLAAEKRKQRAIEKRAIEIVESRMKSPIHSVTEVAQVEDDEIQTKQ